jgi:hypothetical protein
MGSSSLIPVRPALQKYFLPLGTSYEPHPVALRKIYILETSNRTECSVVPLRGIDKFKALASVVYRPRLVADLGLEAELYPQIAELAGKTEVAHLIRPMRPFRLDPLIDLVDRDLA